MVVPRGTGGLPTSTAASRTSSNQGVSRAGKGKAPNLNGLAANGDDSHSSVDGPQFSDDVVFAVSNSSNLKVTADE